MASIYHGRGASIGFGEETGSTYGVAVARTNWRPLISSSLLRTIEKVPRPTLRTGAAGAMRRAHFISADNAGGSFQVECDYNSIGMLCKHLMGTVVDSAGPAPFTHTYTFANTLPIGLTIENIRGTGTSEVFEGCKLSQGVFAVSSAGVMTFDATVIAETSAARGSAGTPTIAATDAPVLHSHAGQLSFNSVNYDVIDMSLTVNNSLATRQKLGSAATLEPLRSDFQSVEMSVTVEVDDVLMAAYIADTESDAVITFTSGSDVFKFTIHNAYLSECSDPVSDANVIRQSLTLVGQSDGTDEGLKIEITNANASGTAN